ncbi:WHG domain-containing protein [Saccharopolyspora indica]|uniref:TetR/AcrR family transcriptional regulator n=1 Tax=Saccharopolyspora indica TaxID=1229659 RepID=UPI0022EAB309|nr:TetR/AcrR family transcriptional regulator [Saccharopolyspora indica]MDA3649007.1 TetR/AcrR family transcriptional regulator [Saccharopolyspora indica]
MSSRTGRTSDAPRRATYRHGDLRNSLVGAGLELAAAGGPDAVVLREVTRQVGVVPNAAYRHFADRRALLSAVSQAALARLAAAMEAGLAAAEPAGDPAASARTRLRALTTGYLSFAKAQPGLFRTAFVTTDMDDTGGEAAAGPGGRTAFQLLSDQLDDLVESGAVPAERRPGAEYFVWSAVHGLAVLLNDGPLRGLRPAEAQDASDRLLDAIERGI